MSQELWDLFKVGGIASIDFFIGGFVGLGMNSIYTPSTPYAQILTQQEFWSVFGVTIVELFLDGILAVCLRKLIYPLDMDDLTGGMFFAMPFLMMQPVLLKNIHLLYQFLMGHFVKGAPTSPKKTENSTVSGEPEYDE